MNKENINYTSEEFWATAPSDAEVLIDHIHFVKWDENGTEWWWSTSECAWDNKITAGSWPLQKYIDCDGFSIIPRPTTFTEPVQENAVSTSDNWFVDGKCVALPPVGTVCEIWGTVGQELRKMNTDWVQVEIIAHTDFGGAPIAVAKDVNCATLGWGTTGVFRPIKKEPTIQEKILEAWKAQGLDFAYDNEDSNFSFKVLVDFVVNNFEVKEKG